MDDVPPLDMSSPLTRLRGDRVLICCLASTVLTFGVTYALSATVDTRKMRSPYFFLSESIDYAPSSCFGSFLLSPACALMACVTLLRKEQLAPVTPPQRFWWLGPLGALGGHGVASFQVHNAPIVHFTFAGMFFGAMTLYLICSVWHERAHSVPTRSELCATLRLITAILAPLLVIAATALTPFMAATIAAGEHFDIENDSDIPTGKRISEYIALLAAIEICIYLNLTTFFASLLPELRSVHLGFKVMRIESNITIGDGTLNEPFINYVSNIS
ncbi:hypothetical protein T492DRAFT_983981 [Pavlovales sp. CCMP2436]|nr:hypothetical protein T492DRAFT_983981 [Pavlovales sp. CCMP2436]|mmetsp:Transcript_3182/g.7850  ORF Transcript_3182/g.7850 Transcript_3182/m.7850 type:complete len:273 (-) Transcript_3182:122-940(-)